MHSDTKRAGRVNPASRSKRGQSTSAKRGEARKGGKRAAAKAPVWTWKPQDEGDVEPQPHDPQVTEELTRESVAATSKLMGSPMGKALHELARCLEGIDGFVAHGDAADTREGIKRHAMPLVNAGHRHVIELARLVDGPDACRVPVRRSVLVDFLSDACAPNGVAQRATIGMGTAGEATVVDAMGELATAIAAVNGLDQRSASSADGKRISAAREALYRLAGFVAFTLAVSRQAEGIYGAMLDEEG